MYTLLHIYIHTHISLYIYIYADVAGARGGFAVAAFGGPAV